MARSVFRGGVRWTATGAMAPLAVRLVIPLVTWGALALALAACPGTLGPGQWPSGSGGMIGTSTGGASGLGTGGMMVADCPDVPTTMQASCAGAACHPLFGDFVKPDGLAARLINQPNMFSPNCNGQTKLVNPTKPASGVLIDRLTTDNCSLGAGAVGRMPPNTADNTAPRPPANFPDCVKAWLEGQLP